MRGLLKGRGIMYLQNYFWFPILAKTMQIFGHNVHLKVHSVKVIVLDSCFKYQYPYYTINYWKYSFYLKYIWFDKYYKKSWNFLALYFKASAVMSIINLTHQMSQDLHVGWYLYWSYNRVQNSSKILNRHQGR
jgi:hypothetical protein